MAYDPVEKFTQPEDAIVILSDGPTDEEIREAQMRIAQGENEAHVWVDIDGRVARREQARLLGDTQ